MIAFFCTALVLIGVAIQVAALISARRLIALLPAGRLRHKWIAMSGLIVVFVACYLGYIVVLWDRHTEWRDVPVPGLFVVGAMFVWLTMNLALRTAVDLLRISKLEVENVTDPLTQVYNRRYLDRRIGEEVARAKRYGLALSVLMLDIDHFKRVNDRYGHQAGDVVLSTLGWLIKTALRESDIVARYGGEEFLVICVNTALAEAASIGERIRGMVESLRVAIPGDAAEGATIQFSISVGVAGLNKDVNDKDTLIQAADSALYRAKHEGRNRVVAAIPKRVGASRSAADGDKRENLGKGAGQSA